MDICWGFFGGGDGRGGSGWEGVDGGGKSRQVKSTGFPNTLVPCQPAQMTDTACLFLASSFSWRSSLRAWWKAVAVVEEVNFNGNQKLIVRGEILRRCKKALWRKHWRKTTEDVKRWDTVYLNINMPVECCSCFLPLYFVHVFDGNFYLFAGLTSWIIIKII